MILEKGFKTLLNLDVVVHQSIHKPFSAFLPIETVKKEFIGEFISQKTVIYNLNVNKHVCCVNNMYIIVVYYYMLCAQL